MFANLFKPQTDLASLVLRWGLAALFVVHGIFKLSTDYALMSDMSLQTQKIVGSAELLAGVALALGLLSRLAALGLIALQVGAIILLTGDHALIGPTFKAKTGADFTHVGPEFNGILIAMCVAVILLGSGAISVDRLVKNMWEGRRRPRTVLAEPHALPDAKGASV